MASTLLYARTIAVGAVLVAPLFAAALQRLLPERTSSRRLEVRTLLAASAASLVLAAVLVPVTAGKPDHVPASFDPVLAAMPKGTVVWNLDSLGGWLLYAHPNVVPTIDTRAEIYGPAYVDAYVRAISGFPGWQATVARTGAQYALVNDDGPLADALQHQSGWTVVEREDPYVLLRQPVR